MADPTYHDLELPGCTPEPLMAYLKALGILRLVSEQKDPNARGWWKNDVFWLRSTLDRGALVKFFLEEYKPTPIVAPWGARSGFYPGSSEKSARTALESIRQSTIDRLAPFRDTIVFVHDLLKTLGLTEKAAKEAKTDLLVQCRAHFPDHLLPWIDACYVLTTDGRKFPPLLGTGGNEGSGSYVSGFAQQVVECIIESKHNEALHCALFATLARVKSDQTPGHFSGRAAGGPNSTQGFEGETTTNPWDYLCCLEGTCLWASAAVRRLGQAGLGIAAFPFTVNVVGAGSTALVTKDSRKPKQAKREIAELWCPLWSAKLSVAEVQNLLGEGRAVVGKRNAANGIDMARAAAALGVDRGITEFARTSFLMRNGQSFLSIPLGRFQVGNREDADMLCQIDPWLDSLRCAASATKPEPPPRFRAALRAIDSAVLDFCRYGGTRMFQNILIALGRAEGELARASGKEGVVGKQNVRPLAKLKRGWLDAADDGSTEFAIARALAGVRHQPDQRGEQQKIGPLRANLEPVNWKKRCHAWAERDRAVVWNAADLATNLANVLQRRLMDGARAGCERLPLASRHTAQLHAIAAFIAGALDDERIEQLIWGLMLIDERGGAKSDRVDQGREATQPSRDREGAGWCALPREYALLKLLFLPRPLVPEPSGERIKWRLARRLADGRVEGGLFIRPEPRILPLLRAGRIGEACRIAAQRLRVSGLPPMPGPLPIGRMRDAAWDELNMHQSDPRRGTRLAAALLIPVSSKSVNRLVHLVCRADGSAAAEVLAVPADGETE